MATVPNDLLINFFNETTEALKNTHIKAPDRFSTPPSLAEQRQIVLNVQVSCLDQLIERYNDGGPDVKLTKEEVQRALRDLGAESEHNNNSSDDKSICFSAMNEMNEEARLAFCRLVLKSEICWSLYDKEGETQTVSRDLIKEGQLKNDAIMEFCGLCSIAVRLPEVKEHLKDSTPLFDTEETSALLNSSIKSNVSNNIMPHERLEEIQRYFLKACGYDSDYASAEIRRIFFNQDGSTAPEYSNYEEVQDTIEKCMSDLKVAAANAVLENNEKLSDHDEGGVTRVVSVSYSEKIVDVTNGFNAQTKLVGGGAPSQESMSEHMEEEQREELRVAREAASLQQSIIDDLMSLSDDAREEKLKEAKEANDEFLKDLLSIDVGPKRIQYLQSISPTTQRLLMMHKLWTNTVVKD